MAQQHVRTRWHKIMPLIEADQIYLTAPDNGFAPRGSDYGVDASRLLSLVEQFGGAPHFVVERELLELATDPDYRRSMIDMHRVGLLRLPYPAIIVEWPMDVAGGQNIVLVRDMRQEAYLSWEPEEMKNEAGVEFYTITLRIHKDASGEYLVVSPATLGLIIDFDAGGEMLLHAVQSPNGLTEQGPTTNELVRQTHAKDAKTGFLGVVAGTLLLATAGVEREVIDTQRLNRKRASSGRPAVPKHTYIHIGRVYRSAEGGESTEYVPRKSPRPHWRRGHLKMVRCGVGRAATRQVFIPPRLVAYQGDAEPARPNYVVTS